MTCDASEGIRNQECKYVEIEHNGACKTKMVRPRLLVVSMSLPVTAKRIGEESWSFTMSPGGLVSALLGK